MESPKELAERKKLEVEAAKLAVETKKADAEVESSARASRDTDSAGSGEQLPALRAVSHLCERW